MTVKVLAVDDSALIHKMYHFFFQRFRSYSLITASNGREALDVLAREDDVDLIVLDINMPVMNGIQFLESTERTQRYGDIPVVIISTEGKEEDTIRGLRLGAAAYLVKPFDPVRLGEVLSMVLAKRGSTSAPGPAEVPDGRS